MNKENKAKLETYEEFISLFFISKEMVDFNGHNLLEVKRCHLKIHIIFQNNNFTRMCLSTSPFSLRCMVHMKTINFKTFLLARWYLVSVFPYANYSHSPRSLFSTYNIITYQSVGKISNTFISTIIASNL